jgi:hypothetical protein
VGFAPRRDAEQLSKTACHAAIVRKILHAVKSRFARSADRRDFTFCGRGSCPAGDFPKLAA